MKTQIVSDLSVVNAVQRHDDVESVLFCNSNGTKQ